MQDIMKPAAMAAALGLAATAPAAAGDPRDRTYYVSAYASEWVEGSLLEIPVRLATLDLQTRQARFLGAGFGGVLVPRFDLPLPFCGGCMLRGNSIELEAVALRHLDLQDHWEVAGGGFLRSGQAPLPLDLSLNVALGAGLSYALSDADLERGRDGEIGVNTYRLQIYLAFEVELAHAAVSDWNLVGRIHHRSGGYGTLTEQGSGSNFIGLGLRRGF